MVLLDLLPVSTGAAFTVAAFFCVVIAAGIGAIMLLRKTIKMALRMIIVAVILMVAVVGSIALWSFVKPKPGSNPADRPARTTSNSNR